MAISDITTAEEWRDIVGYVGAYQVSNLGRVRSLARVVVRRKTGAICVKARLLALSPNWRTKYYSVMLACDGTRKRVQVHQLVAEAFIGHCPPGYEINHKDLDRHNNRIDNLEFVTHLDNIRHAIRAGAINKRGESHHNARLCNQDVVAIRLACANGAIRAEVAQKYGVKVKQIDKIISRERWGHIP